MKTTITCKLCGWSFHGHGTQQGPAKSAHVESTHPEVDVEQRRLWQVAQDAEKAWNEHWLGLWERK